MRGPIVILFLSAMAIGLSNAQLLKRDPRREEASARGAEYLLRAASRDTLQWQPKEAAGAFLAVASRYPDEWRNRPDQSARAIAVKNGVRMSLMQLITSRRGYSGVDNSQLAQYLGAIKVMCDDPRAWAGGHNLLREAERRAERGVAPISPGNAGLSLTLCTAGLKVPKVMLNRLGMVPRNSTRTRSVCRDVCFERAALSVLALSCVFRDKVNEYDKSYVKTLLRTNLYWLHYDYTETDLLNAPANIFKLVLLLQAMHDSPIKLTSFMTSADQDRVARRLMALQRPNGSWGDSVAVTAVVVPALMNYTPQYIRYLKCFKDREATVGEVRVVADGDVAFRVEISEDAFHSQAFVGDMVAREGATLLDAIRSYEQQYPEVLQVNVTENALGAFITDINSVTNRRGLAWSVVGDEEDISKIRVRSGETYRISFGRA